MYAVKAEIAVEKDLLSEKTEESVLKTITYFDVFNYPLTAGEIFLFLDQHCSEQYVNDIINTLAEEKIIFRVGEFYSLKNNLALALRRQQGNKDAVNELKKAEKISGFLFRFPYVRGVAVSGSLSKKFAYKGSDIDFFIITAKNRLWIMKTLFTVFFKIISAFGFKKWFCLNYFIDETALEIEEKNIFTAVEVSTLLPCSGMHAFKEFFEANQWIYQYLPNFRSTGNIIEDTSPVFPKRIFEWLFDNKTGDKIDKKLWFYFYERWQKLLLQKKNTVTGFQFGSYIARKHVCKPFPEKFQQSILNKHKDRFEKAKSKL